MPLVNTRTLPFYRHVLARHMIYKASPLGNTNIWNLLDWRGDTDCSITADRIFALLPLVEGGSQIRVSYEDSHVELFWRVGQHFQAWLDVKLMVHLMIPLRLSTLNLAQGDKQHRHDPIRIMVERVYVRDNSSRKSLPDSCPYCWPSVSSTDHCEILFCANPGSSDIFGSDRTSTHISINRRLTLPGMCNYSATLITILPNIEGSETVKCEAKHVFLQYCSGNEWTSPKDLKTLRSLLKIETMRPVSDYWVVCVPREYVLRCLNTKAASETLHRQQNIGFNGDQIRSSPIRILTTT